MTDKSLLEKPVEEQPSQSAAPVRKKRGLLFVLIAVLLGVFAVPVALVAGLVMFLYLRPAPSLPETHLVELPQPVATEKNEPQLEAVTPAREDEHPLDKALKVAYEGLAHMRKDVTDYTATLLSRERIQGELKPVQTMFVKIRSPKTEGEKVITPLSVYLKFVAPKDKAGREVIYVAGKNNNRLIGHEGGLFNVTSISLDPKGWFAMQGERYPITEIGIERLAEQLIERGEEERLLDPQETKVEVKVEKGFEFQGRRCTRIYMRYPQKVEKVEFQSAEVCIDEELFVPIYYAAYGWPAEPGGEPLLDEEYTYQEIKLNVGLTDADFDPKNKEYKFP